MDRDRGARLVAQWVPGDSGLIHLDTVDLRTPVGPWGLAHPVEIRYGDRLSVGDLVLASGTQRIAVDGDIDRRGDQSLHATVKSVRFGPFAEVLGVRNLDGLADGDFDLEGPAASPRAVGDLSVRFLSAAKRLGRARGSLDWDSLGLNLDLALIPSKGDSLTVKGLVPVGLSLVEGDTAHGVVRPLSTGRLVVDARTSAFRLESLEPLLKSDDIGEVKGLLSMDIAVRGTAEEPETNGSIRLRGLEGECPRARRNLQGHSRGGLGRPRASPHRRQVARRGRRGRGHRSAEAGGLRAGRSGPRSEFSGVPDRRGQELRLEALRADSSPGNQRRTRAKRQVYDRQRLLLSHQRQCERHGRGRGAHARGTGDGRAAVRIAGEEQGRAGAVRGVRASISNVTLGPNNWIRRRSDPVVAVELGGDARASRSSRGASSTCAGTSGRCRAQLRRAGRKAIRAHARRCPAQRAARDGRELDLESGVPRGRPRAHPASRT